MALVVKSGLSALICASLTGESLAEVVASLDDTAISSLLLIAEGLEQAEALNNSAAMINGEVKGMPTRLLFIVIMLFSLFIL